jgi:hypothetical protein
VTFSPRDFEVVAKHLAINTVPKANEATTRTVIGRAYYAVYLAIREALRRQYKDPKYDVAHETLGQTLESCPKTHPGHERIKKIGVSLEMLRQQRVRADYHPEDQIDDLQAGDAVQDVATIFSELPSVTTFPLVRGKPPR